MPGTFTTDEKINYALKSLLQLTTGFGDALFTDEAVSLPSIYPISIKKQNIIKNGEGDLETKFTDESKPYPVVEQYKIIDPGITQPNTRIRMEIHVSQKLKE